MALPKVIHVREQKDRYGTPYLAAFTGGVLAAIDQDGPTLVGVYKLVGKMRAHKVPHVKHIRVRG